MRVHKMQHKLYTIFDSPTSAIPGTDPLLTHQSFRQLYTFAKSLLLFILPISKILERDDHGSLQCQFFHLGSPRPWFSAQWRRSTRDVWWIGCFPFDFWYWRSSLQLCVSPWSTKSERHLSQTHALGPSACQGVRHRVFLCRKAPHDTENISQTFISIATNYCFAPPKSGMSPHHPYHNSIHLDSYLKCLLYIFAR